MSRKNPSFDAYIVQARPFARPILRHLRKVVHAGCPTVEETIKWGHPHFVYKGNIAGMAAFQEHCAFGFWKHALLFGEEDRAREAMGHFGRITRVSDLPNESILIGYVRKAVELNEAGIKLPRPTKRREVLEMPEDFQAALQRNRQARKTMDSFSPSKRRDYIEWVTEAKRAETRRRRITTAIEWLAEGKSRNWKHERKP